VPVPRLAFVTKENLSPTPPKHEGRTKPCRSAADDDYVEHAADLCKEATSCGSGGAKDREPLGANGPAEL